ncbi:MAG: hypothetical protein ACYC96_06035 [Fimbriimonadaceae bacterium]
MNLHLPNKIFISLAALALISTAALGQAPPKVRKTLTNARVDKTFIKLNVRPAIRFVPIPMADRNGKPIDPNATAKLPNGQTITARVYFAQLNAFEQKLNQLGYSLRSGVAKQELASPAITPATLNQQAINLKSLIDRGTVQGGGLTRPKLATNASLRVNAVGLRGAESKTVASLNSANVRGDQLHGMLVDPKDLIKASGTFKLKVNPGLLHLRNPVKPAPPQMESVPINHSKAWNWGYGNQWFGAFFDGAFNVAGVAQVPASSKSFSQDSSSFSASTSGHAGITLFTDRINVVTYNASYSGSDATKQIKINGNVNVLGYTVWSTNKTVPDGYKINGASLIPLDVATPTMEFPVGPFTISGKFGALGSAGISYNLALYYSNISGSVTPAVTSSAYGQVGGGIDLGLASASAGVGVNLTLLNDSLTIGANVGVGWLLGFYLMDDFYIDNSLNALKGNGYFYIKESECFGAFNQEQDFTIFNWGGIQDNSSLVNIKNIIPLDWNG